MSTPEKKPVSPEERIVDVLGQWLRQRRKGMLYWFAYFLWGIVLMIALEKFPPFGLLLMSVFFLRAVFQVFRLMGLGLDVIRTLLPAFEHAPDGLADARIAFAIFDAARVDKRVGAKRVQALKDAAAQMVAEDGPANHWDCRSGHAPICAHRTSKDAVAFWRAVAAR